MRTRRRLSVDGDGTWEIWPAFTDVMSTMALLLFVLVLLAYVRNLISSRRLDALQQQIVLSESQLRRVKDDLRRTSDEVAAGKAALAASQSRIDDEERTIAASNEQLDALRGRLQGIAVLRVEVLTRLKQAIEAELGPSNAAGAPLVSFGDNGNIVINESLVFESSSYAVKPAAKPVLRGLARALGKLLADDAVRDDIDAIVIQGHTDERGSASFNWDLSAKRATAVLDELFAEDRPLADTYGRYFAASAYSKFRPLDATKSPDAYQRNRRIEISVIPKDASVRKVIDEYMQGAAAAPDAGSP
jgi:chemotaxis protein MotB